MNQTAQNVDITGLSKGHISVLFDARVTRSGALLAQMYCACYRNMTLTQSKVKVTGLLKFRKLTKIALFRSISSAILAWSSELMVDYDSMGASLHLVGASS